MGQPVGGFPEPLRTKVLRGKEIIEGRPGCTLPAVDFDQLRFDLQEKHRGRREISHKDALSAALYPKVFDEYVISRDIMGPVSLLPTKAFLKGLEIDEEIEVKARRGTSASIKLKAVGELLPNGKREVFFEVNGIPRVVDILDLNTLETENKKGMTAVRERADPMDLGSVGAPMAGEVVDILVKDGAEIKAGEALIVLSAMKMETTVSAPCNGKLKHIAVGKGDSCTAGDLLCAIEQ